MFETTFVGRQAELDLLERLWLEQKSTLIILYGRRRVGKTRLLTHWLQQHPEDALYWMAEPTSAHDQLRSFSQALLNFADPETPASPDFSYDSWEHALRQVSLLARERRFALFIDEVTYIMDVNPAMAGTLQKAWDHWLSKSNLMLALSGSQMGLMQRHLLSYQAPLYGRATAQIKLPPLPFGVTSQYFPNYDAAERVNLYAIWGGVPAYWERLSNQRSVADNLREQLSPSNAWMLDESRLLLQDFITDPYNYVGIMRAIADGKQMLGEISKRVGLSGGSTSKYMSILRDTGFVAREVPVTKRNLETRHGRYVVTDPYLRFYYRFLAAYQSKIALGQQRQMFEKIQDDLPSFIQANTWTELCREWVLRASMQEEIPVSVEHIGSEWRRSFTIEIAGIDESAHTLVLGACLWDETADPVAAIQNLLKRTSTVLPDDEESWTIYYTLFQKDAWSAKDKELIEMEIRNMSGKRRRWQVEGVSLVDLSRLDADLTRWADETE